MKIGIITITVVFMSCIAISTANSKVYHFHLRFWWKSKNCDYCDIIRIKVLIIPVIAKCDDSNGFFLSEELGNSNDWDSHDSAVMLNAVTSTFTSDASTGYRKIPWHEKETLHPLDTNYCAKNEIFHQGFFLVNVNKSAVYCEFVQIC